MRPPEDLVRELEKIKDAVEWACRALNAQAQHDAACHMNVTVRANPMTSAMNQAHDDLSRLIDEVRT